ncbi:hypothetical protein GCM10023213_19860 [Prosthecobacter algae]|uniref:Phage terminase large subunit GpA-like protein n=2 Tax=Prosthecobacter algae TaxID=1144682 RepID=A0ABP9P5F5_9BACT
MIDLFAAAASARFLRTPESDFLIELFDSCMHMAPTEAVWKWADREVWLDEKMTAKPGQYDSSYTPWTREWQELPMRPEVREGIFMKSSRTGVSEASLNILRWMPKNWPGNALYSINSDKKAREVAERRILPSVERTAGGQMTDDENDKTLSRISLKNMDMLISGSGSDGPFMEIWYRLIILDELEKHVLNQGTTTYDRAKSRQTDVADGLLLALSKPEEAGGIIDLKYINGTQKKFLVPCPRCERRIELLTKFLMANECKEADGWNLERVVKDTYYQCQLCQQPIQSHEKKAMVNEGIWVPTPVPQRRRPSNGKYVPPEPGVESYQISDLYSLFERVSWGNLMKMYLQAYEINPNEEAKKYFRVNHEGMPWENETYNITGDSVKALKAGRIEEKVVKAVDGTEQRVRLQLGKEYRLAYRDGKWSARLPFRPALLTVSIDKQFDFLKYMVFAWTSEGAAFLVDLGRLSDEDQLWQLRKRPYLVEERGDKPEYIFSGLIDSGHRRDEVFRACIKQQTTACEIHPGGWNLHPSRGEGKHEDYRGKLTRLMTDYIDGQEIIVRYYYDHGIKNEFYLGRIQKRTEPRLWLPTDYPDTLEAEWTAEVFDKSKNHWEHDKAKKGPNDWGDTGKMQYVMLQEMREDLKNLPLPD